ncbi:MAG TPA: cytochrome c [Nitrosospira sp.]|nr:cytochrome c [Nitrosospira sp.]
MKFTATFSCIAAWLICLFAYTLQVPRVLAQSAPTIEFRKDNQTVKTFSVDDLAAIAPPVPLKVFEAHEKEERVYRAIPARPVFERIFGKNWEKAQQIVFTSIDGYQPSVPVEKFLAHNAYLALAHDDGSPFIMLNKLQNNEKVPLGPLYLIWDNIGSKALLESGASDMPYQIKTIEIKSEDPFAGLAPPKGSSKQVLRGFDHFRKYCVSCHTINGEGGGKAPELNYPVSVSEYIKPEYLKRWIEQPQTIRYNTMMPALGHEVPNRDKVADEIIAYLKMMSIRKRVPEKSSGKQ